MSKILVTGSSGFIGMHLCFKLLDSGYQLLGIDNMNDYYDVNLKEARLFELLKNKNFKFEKADICDLSTIESIFRKFKPQKVINLAAQAGVRYSLINPQSYIYSNIMGFMNILEVCKKHKVQGLIYASSSSVYGKNKIMPFSVKDVIDKPISIYGASKISNELMAHAYSHLYGIHTTGLRFFTVYGPWGRPDMAMYIFTRKIMRGEKITVFNHGKMKRDFTYIDDIINGIMASIEKNYKREIFNLGNNRSEDLMEIISIIENYLGKKANIVLTDIQPGDVKKTFADIEYSKKYLNYIPKTTIFNGVPKFIDWYLNYMDKS